MTTIDTDQVNARHDLRRLAAQHTELRRESASEMSGACPRCGGTDRFHAGPDFFFCRSCYPLDNKQPHDAIAFMRWLHACSFQEAVTMLAPDATPRTTTPATPARPRTTQTQTRPAEAWIAEQTPRMAAMRASLFSDAGRAGLHFAIDRGFDIDTLDVFHVGYCVDAMHRGPALAFPYYRNGELYGIHYRYLNRETKPKYIHESGSKVAGLLFGGHALSRRGRNLIVVEGELNAMSVWQVAAGARVNVLSLGGESTSLTPAAVEYIRSFPVRIVWMDKEALATEKAKQINGHATWSGEGDEKQDANDLLQRMTLQRRVADLLTLAGALPDDVRELGG